MNSDREARKKALEAAKERLAYRRKQKEQLQLLRQQKQSGASTGFESKNDYGKKLVADTQEIIRDWSSTKVKEEKEETEAKEEIEKDGATEKREIVPGPRADLNMVNNVNTVDVMKRSRVEYVKEIQTDAVEIGQHCKSITEQTNNLELNEILATFIESDCYPYPNKKDAVYKRITIEEEETEDKQDMKESNDTPEKGDGKEDGTNKLVLSNEEATTLISSATFIESFRDKSLYLESILGINEEHSVFIEANQNDKMVKSLGGNQMEKLIKSSEISGDKWSLGRAITCLDFDYNHGANRFLASYSGHIYGDDSTSEEHKREESRVINIKPDGLINIFDLTNLTLITTLECQSMINCCTFHPTKQNMIIGASVSGQVLGWDMRLNKKTPTIRTEFSSSCHTQPIFCLNFLPVSLTHSNASNKIRQILTLSNDAKLCVWRDDMLYKPNNEFLLKLSKKQSTSAPHTQQQAKEITTTCFSYPNKNNTKNKLYLGSDEGSIYCTSLNLNSHSDEKELHITSYINNAHYGPITCINFHKQYPLYLTSSFDWTVKLWHTSSSKPLALFNNMQDYVYDVAWSPTNPSIFAIGDGSGNLTIFDLNTSFEHPASEPTNILHSEKENRPNNEQVSITKILWSPTGKSIIVGDSNGKISIFDCPVYDTVDNDFDKFEAIIKRKLESNDR